MQTLSCFCVNKPIQSNKWLLYPTLCSLMNAALSDLSKDILALIMDNCPAPI